MDILIYKVRNTNDIQEYKWSLEKIQTRFCLPQTKQNTVQNETS